MDTKDNIESHLIEYDDKSLTPFEIFPKGTSFRISFDSTLNRFRIISISEALFEEVRNVFSTTNKNAFMIKQYGYNAPDKIYAINKFGYFLPGMVFEILKWIKTTYGSLNVVAISDACKKYMFDYLKPLKGKLDINTFEVSNIMEDRCVENKFDYRDYQRNAITSLLCVANGRGLIEVPTGGGKSAIISGFIWNIYKHIDSSYKFLILVPNKQLVEQFYKDLLEYGYKEEELTKFTAFKSKKEGTYNPNANIIIANRQYIFKNKDKLPKIDVLIGDEAHQVTADATMQLIESIDCKIKVGCSGTLPRDKAEKWKLIGMFGPIVYTENITNLQKSGYISNLKITVIKIIDKYVEGNRDLLFHLDPKIKYYQDEYGVSNIMFNDAFNAEIEYYNKWCVELYRPVLQYLTTLDENILVLFDRIEFGQKIFEEAKTIFENIKNVHYIDGSTDIKEREIIRETLEKTGNNIIFAQTAVFSTGINIKRLNHICFMFNSKSFSRVLQSIGRTLRLHSAKEKSHLIDIFFNYKYSTKHMKEKMKIYGEMYGKKKADNVIQMIVNN